MRVPTGQRRVLRNRTIVSTCSGGRLLAKAGMLGPPFVILASIWACVMREPTCERSGPFLPPLPSIAVAELASLLIEQLSRPHDGRLGASHHGAGRGVAAKSGDQSARCAATQKPAIVVQMKMTSSHAHGRRRTLRSPLFEIGRSSRIAPKSSGPSTMTMVSRWFGVKASNAKYHRKYQSGLGRPAGDWDQAAGRDRVARRRGPGGPRPRPCSPRRPWQRRSHSGNGPKHLHPLLRVRRRRASRSSDPRNSDETSRASPAKAGAHRSASSLPGRPAGISKPECRKRDFLRRHGSRLSPRDAPCKYHLPPIWGASDEAPTIAEPGPGTTTGRQRMDYAVCRSLPAMFFETARRRADRPFLWAKRDRVVPAALTWPDAAEQGDPAGARP